MKRNDSFQTLFSLNISCIMKKVSSEKVFIVPNSSLVRILSWENGNHYSSFYIETRKNAFQKSECPFFKKNKMRKPRIYIRVLCVLQKAKTDIQFFLFFFCPRYFISFTAKLEREMNRLLKI